MNKKLLFLVGLLAILTSCSTPAYKNSNLSPEERAEDLLSRLTLEEKISLMMDVSAPVERLGIKAYNWWNEALHGVARSGLATVFPQPIGMAATFDTEGLRTVYEAVSDEARAKNTAYSDAGSYGRYQGLTFWTPTINILRDPRWGRGIETYGEDPYLTGQMGLNVVKGLQCRDADSKYDKLHACAKHFAVHSGPEWKRHQFNVEDLSARDLYETYLAPFETLVKEGKVQEVMCAYNRFENDPCCGSNRLLTHILRDEWKYEGIVISDCGAIDDFYQEGHHETHADAVEASSAAVLSGTDLECGSSYQSLLEGVKKGLIKESDIDVSLKRLLKARFALGVMDDPSKVDWRKIPYSVVASAKHDSLALDMARKSMTLLLNKNNILPLERGGKVIAVMGPNANDSVMQWGNYNGFPLKTVTILDGIRAALGKDDRLIYEPGCSWVERTMIKSVFNQCKSNGNVGFTASYWNNTDYEGDPVTTLHLDAPFQLSATNSTSFAPGVNATDFSATYQSTFTPTESGEIIFDIYSYGVGKVLVDGKETGAFSNMHGGRTNTFNMNVEAGKSYDIEIQYQYYASDAKLGFDLNFKENVNIQRAVANVKDADVVIFVGGISPRLEGEEMGSGDGHQMPPIGMEGNPPGGMGGNPPAGMGGNPPAGMGGNRPAGMGGNRPAGMDGNQPPLPPKRALLELPGFKGGDRTDIELPAVQRELIKALHDAGKKVILVNCSGSAMGFEPEMKYCQAILQAWYPGQAGGTAVAETLFGENNPSGHLPMTFYRNIDQVPDFEDYNMAGRTYRYFKGDPLFAFGYGLSYTTFKYGDMQLAASSIAVGETAKVIVPVTNTGSRDGEEVVQLYLKKQGDEEGPIKALRAFKHVKIPAGETVNVELELTPKQLEWWDTETNSMRTQQAVFDVMVGCSSQEKDLQTQTLTLL